MTARGRTVLITGCSSGIGLAAASEFASRGFQVVATMRNLDRSGPLREALAHEQLEVDIRVMDVADDVSVASVTGQVVSDYGGLDVIVSNAGVGVDGTIEELSVDSFRTVFETNVLGSVRLLQAAMPTWRAAGSGRFIAVGSISGLVGFPFNDAYCMSKFGLEGLLESFAPVASQFGVQVSIVEPGPVTSAFFDNVHGPVAGAGDDAAEATNEIREAYGELRQAFEQVQGASFEAAQGNGEIAVMLYEVATADEPKLRYQTSEMVQRMAGLKFKDLTGERIISATSRWIGR